MKAYLAVLLAGPESKADEMALVALLIGLCFVFSLLALTALWIFVIIFRHNPWDPEGFARAAAILFGTAGAVMAAMQCGMGVKAKLGG